jgi:hypothetical protein
MTNVTLPNFVENIEKGFIVVGNTFVDACEIISISKINETAIMIKFGNADSSEFYHYEEAVEFLEKYNQFLTFKK